MSSSANGRRKAKRLALLRRAESTAESKSPVAVEPAAEIMTGRVIVPFVIVEHARKDGASLGIFLLEQAIA